LPSIVFVVAKPIVGMPKELITLGDHIKKKRLESNKTQKDVGKVIGTDNFTIVNWEKNSTKNIPAKYYPKMEGNKAQKPCYNCAITSSEISAL
jgi:DNA-binding XRE family transcriptional regulator